MAAEEGRGVEYALSDLAECIRLLIGRVREDSSHADKAARLKALREAVHLHFGAAGGEYVLPSQQAWLLRDRAREPNLVCAFGAPTAAAHARTARPDP